jgi:hypothetical protein
MGNNYNANSLANGTKSMFMRCALKDVISFFPDDGELLPF